MLVLWGRKTHIEDLLIAWQTHCTMQVTTVHPHSCFWLINCEYPIPISQLCLVNTDVPAGVGAPPLDTTPTVKEWLPCVFRFS